MQLTIGGINFVLDNFGDSAFNFAAGLLGEGVECPPRLRQ